MPRGGARPGAGRKPIGDKPMMAKTVHVSMPKENWELLEAYLRKNQMDAAVYFRDLAMNDMLCNEDFYKK